MVGLVTAMAGPTGYAANPARDLGPRIAHFVLPIPNKVAITRMKIACTVVVVVPSFFATGVL